MSPKGRPKKSVAPHVRKVLNLCDAEQRSRILSWMRARKSQEEYRAKSPEKTRAARSKWQAKAVARGHYRADGPGYRANRAAMARNAEHYRQYHRDYYLSVTKPKQERA